MSVTSWHNSLFHRKDMSADPVSEGEQDRFFVPQQTQDAESDELAAFLGAIQHDDIYRVDETLKESPYELTQKVSKSIGPDQWDGPYIRKYLDLEAGLGSVYEMLYEAQRHGRSFSYFPRIYECYRLHKKLVVVMEFIQGETLQDVVFRSDPSPSLAYEVFPRVCSAVRELHEGFTPPIIHRDLKPTNIIMGWDRLALIDFGIARVYRPCLSADTLQFGTREYAPPEQFGYGQTDVRSDVYALGMLLYYCLTEETADAQVRQAGFTDKRIPEELRRIIKKATAFDPQDRYESVAALQRDFDQAFITPHTSGDRASSAEHMSHTKSFTDKIPKWLGVTWNSMLVLAWILCVVACIDLTFNPTRPQDVAMPLWLRAFVYCGVMNIDFTATTYVLLDRRRIRKRFKIFHGVPLRREYVLYVIVMMISALLLSIAYSLQ